MKMTDTIAQFFPIMRSQLTAMQLDVEHNPQEWHQALRDAIDQGAFIKIEFALVAGGKVDSRLLLVSPKGEAAEICMVGGGS
jgi:hypothetical protein